MLSVFIQQATRFDLLSQRENSQTSNFFLDNLNMYKTSLDSKLSYENVFKCFTPKKILKWDSLFRSLLLSGEGELILWNNLEEKSPAIKYLDSCSCSTSRSWSPISPEGSPASLSNSTHLIKTPSKALDRLLIKHNSQNAIWIEYHLGPWWYISLNQF